MDLGIDHLVNKLDKRIKSKSSSAKKNSFPPKHRIEGECSLSAAPKNAPKFAVKPEVWASISHISHTPNTDPIPTNPSISPSVSLSAHSSRTLCSLSVSPSMSDPHSVHHSPSISSPHSSHNSPFVSNPHPDPLSGHVNTPPSRRNHAPRSITVPLLSAILHTPLVTPLCTLFLIIMYHQMTAYFLHHLLH